MKNEIEWFTVRVTHTDRVTFELFGELEKGSLFISAGGRLCGPGASVCLDSQPLADTYCQALAIRRKKIDPDFEAETIKMSSYYKQARALIERDSNKVREKLTRWGIEIPD